MLGHIGYPGEVMKRICKLVLAAAMGAMLLGGCGGSGDDTPPTAQPLQSLRIVSASGDVSEAWSLELSPTRLYYQGEPFPGTAAQFTATPSAEDFNRMSSLVTSQELTKKLALPNTTHTPCRLGELQIAIGQGNVLHEFRIPGTQRCGAAIQPGLSELLDLSTQLIRKYRPAPAA